MASTRASPGSSLVVWRAGMLALLCTSSAHAQVNKCQIGGQPVYRSAPCPLEPRAAAAPVAVAATPGAPKKKTLADLLRERDGAGTARPAAAEPPGDGANVLRSRMGAV